MVDLKGKTVGGKRKGVCFGFGQWRLLPPKPKPKGVSVIHPSLPSITRCVYLLLTLHYCVSDFLVAWADSLCGPLN